MDACAIRRYSPCIHCKQVVFQIMNILDFAINYPDEETCRKKFKQLRDQMGVTCRRCNCKEHYWLENKQAYECKRCQARHTLRSSTVMRHSNLPYRYWFVAMHLLTATKGSFFAEISVEEKEKPLKRGRGSQKKTKVLVMAESKTVENPKPGKKPKKVRYLKMKVINELKADTITKNVKEHVHSHTASVVTHEELPNVLPWVHTAISNAKLQILGVYYKVKPEYL